MESSKNGVSKKLVLGLGCVSVIVLCVIILTLVVFMNNQKNNCQQFYDSGSVVMTYAENSNIFFINNMSILDDESGKTNMVSGQYYDFTVNAELGDSKQTDYEIVLKIDNNFFYKQNVILTEEENEALFNQIKKNKNDITLKNYKKYLYDPLLNIRFEKKQSIEKALEKFIQSSFSSL